jgi:hypothetical protein
MRTWFFLLSVRNQFGHTLAERMPDDGSNLRKWCLISGERKTAGNRGRDIPAIALSAKC